MPKAHDAAELWMTLTGAGAVSCDATSTSPVFQAQVLATDDELASISSSAVADRAPAC